MNLREKVVVVTGASSGIGRACALEFAAHKATVLLLDQDQRGGEAVVEQIKAQGGSASLATLDLSDYSLVDQTIADLVSVHGGIDILAHCAGIQTYGTAESTSLEAWSRALAVNLDSAFYLSKCIVPVMIARQGGSIVFTGSTQSLVAHRNCAAYVTGKHAIVGLMRSVALDFARHNIRANCVLPGAIDTPMLRSSAALDKDPEQVIAACHRLALMGRMGTPEEVANAVLFLSSDQASFITGTTLVVDGGQLVPCGGTLFQEVGTGAPE